MGNIESGVGDGGQDSNTSKVVESGDRCQRMAATQQLCRRAVAGVLAEVRVGDEDLVLKAVVPHSRAIAEGASAGDSTPLAPNMSDRTVSVGDEIVDHQSHAQLVVISDVICK